MIYINGNICFHLHKNTWYKEVCVRIRKLCSSSAIIKVLCPWMNPLNSLIQLLPVNLQNIVFDLPTHLGCCEEQMRLCVVKFFVNYRVWYTLDSSWPGILQTVWTVVLTDMISWASNKRHKGKNGPL